MANSADAFNHSSITVENGTHVDTAFFVQNHLGNNLLTLLYCLGTFCIYIPVCQRDVSCCWYISRQEDGVNLCDHPSKFRLITLQLSLEFQLFLFSKKPVIINYYFWMFNKYYRVSPKIVFTLKHQFNTGIHSFTIQFIPV
jgi:hypothetical protein